MLYNVVLAYLLTQTMKIMNQKAIYFLFTVITLPLTLTAHSSTAAAAHPHARTHAIATARSHAHHPQSCRCHRHSSHLQHTGTPPSRLLHPHTRSCMHPAVAPCRTARICTPHACTRTQHTRRPRSPIASPLVWGAGRGLVGRMGDRGRPRHVEGTKVLKTASRARARETHYPGHTRGKWHSGASKKQHQ
jgi:hypothetical protein